MAYFKIQHILLANEFDTKWGQLLSVSGKISALWKLIMTYNDKMTRIYRPGEGISPVIFYSKEKKRKS